MPTFMVANRRVQEFLFHNNGDGTFTEVGLDAGVDLLTMGARSRGMGVDFRDYDNDGLPDIVITTWPARSMRCSITMERHVQLSQHGDRPGSADCRKFRLGMRLEDFDNDGWKDLFVFRAT